MTDIDDVRATGRRAPVSTVTRVCVLAVALAAASSLSLLRPAVAGPPGLDPAWGENGIATLPGDVTRTVTTASAGTTTYVATATAGGTDTSPAVLALDAAGEVLAPFGDAGRVVLSGAVWPRRPEIAGMAVDGQSRVVVVMNYYDVDVGRWVGYDVLRLTASGALDSSFHGDGRLSVRSADDTTVTASAPRTGPSDSVIFTVSRQPPYGHVASSVERLAVDGTPDPAFAGGTVALPEEAYPSGLVVEPSGRVLVGLQWVSGSRLLALQPDGTPDPGFGSAGSTDTGQASHLWRLADGTLLRQRQGYGNDPAELTAWTPAGVLDTTFGDGGTVEFEPGCMTMVASAVAQEVTPDGTGDLVVVVAESCGDDSVDHLYRLSAIGEPLEVLPDGVDAARPLDVRSLTAAADGSVIVGGDHAAGSQEGHGAVARLVSDVAVRGTGFTPLPPTRLLDTREGLGAPQVRLGPQSTLRLKIAGAAGVPDDAAAVVLNVTAVEATDDGFVTLWPTGQPRPDVSNLNVLPGTTRPNAVTVKIGDAGSVELFNQAGAMDVVVDVAGYYSTIAGVRFTPLAVPARLLDTREGVGAAAAPATAAAPVRLQVTGRVGVPASATAVVMNVTAVQPTRTTHVTVWPGDAPRPTASNLNLRAGEIAPNLVTVRLGADGTVALAPGAGAVHVVADVAGWYGPDGLTRFVPLRPSRLLDTRDDGYLVGQGETVETFVEMGGVPTYATAVALNLTAVLPSTAGHVVAYPTGQDRPVASNLNLSPGVTVPNLAVVRVGDWGLVDLYNSQGTTHLLADVAGYFTD